MTKIAMGKTRPVSNPWLTIEGRGWNQGWTYKVLKANIGDPEKQYASWFVDVQSPYTNPGSDMGDTYIKEIEGVIVQRDPEVPDSALPRWLR